MWWDFYWIRVEWADLGPRAFFKINVIPIGKKHPFGQLILNCFIFIYFLFLLVGFLSTGDSYAPGNVALLDQVAALHWIKENIEAFGGDPQEVTLLGQGYGGAMVNLLLISPVTKGLEGLHAFLHYRSLFTVWMIFEEATNDT